MRIVSGADYCTLVTCTPYGVNSHRLLVHGTRCAYHPDEDERVGIDAYVNSRNAPLLAALALVASCALAGLIAQGRRRGNQTGKAGRIRKRNGG